MMSPQGGGTETHRVRVREQRHTESGWGTETHRVRVEEQRHTESGWWNRDGHEHRVSVREQKPIQGGRTETGLEGNSHTEPRRCDKSICSSTGLSFLSHADFSSGF